MFARYSAPDSYPSQSTFPSCTKPTIESKSSSTIFLWRTAFAAWSHLNSTFIRLTLCACLVTTFGNIVARIE